MTYDELLRKYPDLADYLRRLRKHAPPLSDETADTLGRLFAPYDASGRDAA